MKRAHITFEERQEEYLSYHKGDPLGYQRQMADFLLPSLLDPLLKHFNELNKFLDELYLMICGTDNSDDDEDETDGQSMANNNNNNSNSNNNQMEVDGTKTNDGPVVEEDPYAWFKEIQMKGYIDGSDDAGILGGDEESEAPTLHSIEEEEEEGVAQEAVSALVSEETRKEQILDAVDYGALCETLLDWHKDVANRDEQMTGVYAICYFNSWGAFCRSFHLNACNNIQRISDYTTKTADKYAYVELVKRHELIVVSDKPIIDYTDTEMWNAIRLVLASLYRVRYSPEMKDYIYALFFRYCDLLSLQQRAVEDVFQNPVFVAHHDRRPTPELGNGENDDSNSSSCDEDSEDLESLYSAFKSVQITANRKYSIENEFVFEGQPIFCPQIERLMLSSKLHRNEDRIRIAYTRSLTRSSFLRAAIDSWAKMCAAVAEDGALTTEIIADFRSTVMQMHLWHGETERFKRESPGLASQPRNVLESFRPLEVGVINKVESQTIRVITGAHKKDFLAQLKEWDSNDSPNDANLPFLNNELEATLLTQICTMRWLEMNKARHLPTLKACYVMEELNSIEKLNALFYKPEQKRAPVLLKLMRIYYVMDIQSGRLFKTQFQVEAYFLWLALCLRAKLLSLDKLPPDLVAVLSNLIKLIVTI